MGHSFRLSNNNAIKRKKSKMDYSIFIIIFFIVIAIVCIILSISLFDKKEEVEYIQKIDSNKEYVYTIKKEVNETQEETNNEVPIINIDSPKVTQLNNEIMSTYEKVKENIEYDYQYRYNQSENILSLLIQYIYIPKNSSSPINFYKTYHVDLENGQVLSYDDLLKLYGIEKQELNTFVEAKFQEHYRNLISKKYYTEKECSYSCFLKNRGISTDYLNGTSLYVEDNSLTLFKFYYTTSKYNEEDYFSNISYQITVKEKR